MGTRTSPKASIIGSGRVGSAIGMALHERGYPITSIINRSGASALALAKAVHCKTVSTQVSDIDPASEIVLIAVSDNALESTVDALLTVRKLSWKKLFVAHVSGAASSRILGPLEKRGVIIASMHPIQTFPKSKKRTSVRGLLRYRRIRGEDRKGRRISAILARSIIVPKPLYIQRASSPQDISLLCSTQSATSRSVQGRAPWTDVFGR
jgi:predicted short-subunit dehydrogenase-like oxidoreductase (DUF2520 family)